jgi:DNA-binding NarL/FixJ family response regulator
MKGAVLLVEDEDDTRQLLGLALERAGYAALLANGPVEASARAAKERAIDVVVTDVVLQGLPSAGLDLMLELRNAGVSAPFVIITAYADVAKVKRALNQGAKYLLEKPFRATDLVAVVDRVRAPGTGLMQGALEVLRMAGLTAKEHAVALHLLDGLSVAEIAQRETNSPKTISQHVSQIYAKCGVSSRAEFLRLAYTR